MDKGEKKHHSNGSPFLWVVLKQATELSVSESKVGSSRNAVLILW